MPNASVITPGNSGNFTSTIQKNQGTEAQIKNQATNTLVTNSSNLGATNPFKKYNPRSLFYDGAKLDSGVPQGSFLFYSFDSSGGSNTEIQNLYSDSESFANNTLISSIESKNPSAYHLVTQTTDLAIRGSRGGKSGNSIVGGRSAPYYWKDFLYSKYYAKIPNNYMLTLRRYPSPMNDNLSLPRQVKDNPKLYEQGMGLPVSQIVTWVGGNTGNKLSDILKFTTGLKFEPMEQKTVIEQDAFSQGFLKDITSIQGLNEAIKQIEPSFDPSNTSTLKALGMIFGASTPESFKETVATRINYEFLNKLVGSEGEPGPLSGLNIFTSLDVITSSQIRKTGLEFTWDGLIINAAYELTSVGNVNTKAAMLDILGNILSMGTNYGSFLTPYIRYNNEFPSVAFPGGDAGKEEFYRNPKKFVENFLKDFNSGDPGTSAGNLKNTILNNKQLLAQLQTSLKTGSSESVLEGGSGSELTERVASGVINYGKGGFPGNLRMPQSVLTGAPIGEWHLVVGNPMNPIAMIGNLICTGVDVTFGDALGPDDFPTEINAKFTLKHARPRERGEIESIFNRGDGRLYQSVAKTQSANVSAASVGTTNGTQILSQDQKVANNSGFVDYSLNTQP
jgi:hypothetical protein